MGLTWQGGEPPLHPQKGPKAMSEKSKKRTWNEAKRRSRRRVNLRLSEEEFSELERRAELTEASISAYVKAAALEAPMPRRTTRPVSIDRAAVLKLLAELGRIGSNLNQTAKANNVLARAVSSSPPADVAEVKRAITDGSRSLEQTAAHLVMMKRAIYDALHLK